MEPFASVNMQTHPCYTFLQRMTNCVKTEDMASRMCFEEIEDWFECKSRRKHRAFTTYLRTETKQMKMYSLPKYDWKTDTFNDGPLPKDLDSYFSQPTHK